MKFMFKVATAALTVLTLAACTGNSEAPSGSGDELTSSSTLTVVTHGSFELPEELTNRFAEESGLEVTFVQPGDAGAVVNQLILTKDSPLGDVVYGVDNSYAARAWEAGILSPYQSEALPEGAEQVGAEGLTPIDFSDVCLNADTQWFEEEGLAIPTTLDDLVKPEYKDLLVVSDPTSSSPGLAFLFATVGAKGEGWLDYWGQLKDNGVKIAPGWTEAYYTEFSGSDGEGSRPLALSYASSPAFAPSTEALLGACFRQVEYAGVLAGAQNEVGARAFIDFLLSPDVQAALPESMYMYPIVADTALPEEWAANAPLATSPIEVSPEEIELNREQWLRDWIEAMG